MAEDAFDRFDRRDGAIKFFCPYCGRLSWTLDEIGSHLITQHPGLEIPTLTDISTVPGWHDRPGASHV